MKPQDIDELRRNMRKFMKLRNKNVLNFHPPNGVGMFAIRIMPFVAIVLIGFTIWYGVNNSFSGSDTMFFYALTFAFLAAALLGRVLMSVPPKTGKDEIERWIWKRNLKLNIYGFLFVIGLTSSYSFIYQDAIRQAVLVLNLITVIIVAFCFLLVHAKPSLFLNSFINSIGTSAIIAFVILYLLRLVFTNQFHWFLIGAVALTPIIRSWWTGRKTQLLTLFQMAVLQSIDTDRLFKSLRSFREVLRDKSRALDIWLRLEEKFSYGEKEEFIRLLVSVNDSEKKRFYKIIINLLAWVLLAIVGAIVALLVEDFLYAPVLKTYFCDINFLQSWLSCSK
ncbi:MAG: hypothetical protein IH588_07200 [Anaerolineales bacterium]|nr:hypothetical protein [Anaerolineales bacterium]